MDEHRSRCDFCHYLFDRLDDMMKKRKGAYWENNYGDVNSQYGFI